MLGGIEPGRLEAFRAWWETQGDSPNTESMRRYAVATFLSVAYRDGILSHAPAQRLGT
jgi:hypothetical protein